VLARRAHPVRQPRRGVANDQPAATKAGGLRSMKLIAYTRGERPRIRPAVLERDWMDASPSRYAYRCLPLNIANCHGWEILCPARTRAAWSGGQAPAELTVASARNDQRPISLFGCGVLTFPVGCLLRTEPGINLWITGPPNRPKHGIAPLTGVVETDWSPFSFTMNWRFHRPGRGRVRGRRAVLLFLSALSRAAGAD